MLTDRQISLVESSWSFILHNANDVGIIFYAKLFEADPGLRRMFKGDMNAQSQKLVDMITFAVHKLNNIDAMVADIKELGIKHRENAVRLEHYQTVAQTLLWTLEKTLGHQWDEEVKDAWATVYGLLSKTMIAGAQGD